MDKRADRGMSGKMAGRMVQAEDGIRDVSRDWSSDVCSSDLEIRTE